MKPEQHSSPTCKKKCRGQDYCICSCHSPEQQEWEKEFDEKFFQNPDEERVNGWLAMKSGIFMEDKECSKICIPDDVKSFISSLLSKEREKVILKGERNRIIHQLREEVRKEEYEKVIAMCDSIKTERNKCFDSSYPNEYAAGFNNAFSQIKSNITKLIEEI